MFGFRHGSLHAGSVPLEVIAREGDLLAVMSAGAYAMCMSPNCNTQPRAAEAMVGGERTHLARERERLEALSSLEHPLPHMRSLK